MISVGGALALALLAAVAGAATVVVYAQIRHRPSRTVASVLAALQDGIPLRDALSQVLGDPTLVVWYRLTGSARWVEPDGHFVPEPNPAPGRAQTTIERSGLPIAVFDYDARLAANWDVITAVAKAASLAVQNERLNAEQRAQYAELVTVTDTAPSLLVNVSTEGRILNQNQAAVAVAGAANQEQIRGSYFWDVYIDPSERDDVQRALPRAGTRLLLRRVPEHVHEPERRATRHLLAKRAGPGPRTEPSSASSPAGSTSPIARILLEEMQRERAFLNAIANNAPSLLALIDETGRVVDLATNIAFEQTLGFSPDETGGHLFWERYVDPAEADDVKSILERVFAGEVVGENDHHWVTSTGRRLLIAWTCTSLPRLDDRTLFLISGVDVTERVEREQEVQRRRDFLNAITRAVPSFLIAVDPDGTFVEDASNRAFRETFGWTEAGASRQELHRRDRPRGRGRRGTDDRERLRGRAGRARVALVPA